MGIKQKLQPTTLRKRRVRKIRRKKERKISMLILL